MSFLLGKSLERMLGSVPEPHQSALDRSSARKMRALPGKHGYETAFAFPRSRTLAASDEKPDSP
jgi:hypothetical protein